MDMNPLSALNKAMLALQEASAALEYAMLTLREAKPKERSEQARRFAVTITDLEKVIAYYETYISGV